MKFRSLWPRIVCCLVVVTALWCVACEQSSKIYAIEKANPQTKRTLPVGEIVGGDGRYGAYAWLGIPYAEPPVGDLRWRDPQPAKPWAGVHEALSFGAACPQYTSMIAGVSGPRGTVGGDEDCLSLNVFSPPIAADAVPKGDARLPVMLWIHGGGNSVGAAARYEGGHLATTQKAIVVTVQYRLGPLGWFRLAALRDSAKTDTERSGNYGLLDILLALRWVHDNIAAFGGSPDNVTVFGESAGAKNTYSLLISPLAKGLFHRAIAESGGVYCSSAAEAENFADAPEPGSTKSSGEVVLALLQDEFNLDRAAAKRKLGGMSPAAVAAYLRSKSAKQIIAATPTKKTIAIYPQLFDDGVVISSGCARNFQRPDGWNKMPVILGTTRDEARLFLFRDERFIRTDGLIPQFVHEDLYLRTTAFISKMMKVAGADLPAAAIQAQQQDAFVYRFDWDEEPTLYGADLSKMFGAAHGMEVPFVFGHFDLGGKMANMIFTADNRAGRLALSDAVMGYWGEFARTGKPGRGTSGNLPEWAPFGSARNHMVFAAPKGGGWRLEKSDLDDKAVIAAMLADKALGVAGQCEMLQSRVYIGWGFTKEDYAAVPECKPFPYHARADL